MSFCASVGFSGYVAAIECRSVHVDLPNSSTSGGQSEGVLSFVAKSLAVAVTAPTPATALDVALFVIERKSSNVLHVRHLKLVSNQVKYLCKGDNFFKTYGFPFSS